MVIMPLWNDQFGNAARVEAAGVGKTIEASDIDARRLWSAVEHVTRDPEVSGACARLALHTRERAESELPELLTFVERHTGIRL